MPLTTKIGKRRSELFKAPTAAATTIWDCREASLTPAALKELAWLLQEPPVADEAGGSPVLGVAAAELELVVSAGAR
jgi:hypothetical protein